MKNNAIGQVIAKLTGLGKDKPLDALEAAQAAGHAPDSPPETEHPQHIFEMVPATEHRPDLPDQAMTFDEHTGLPHIAMEHFPLPHEEEDDALVEMV